MKYFNVSILHLMIIIRFITIYLLKEYNFLPHLSNYLIGKYSELTYLNLDSWLLFDNIEVVKQRL